jgi:hypothetical protein
MSHYFFDLKSAGVVSQDEEGMELPDAEAAHDVALDALVTAARDAVVEGSQGQTFRVDVRNGTGPVLELTATFNSKFFRTQ